MSREVLLSPLLKHPRLIIGDFKRMDAACSKSLQHSFEASISSLHLNRKRPIPAVLPISRSGPMYLIATWRGEFLLHRSRMALLASIICAGRKFFWAEVSRWFTAKGRNDREGSE